MSSTSMRLSPLLLILVAAVVQGWALYGLHLALVRDWWPADSGAWLLTFYTVAVFVPTTVQLLAYHSATRAFWPCIGLIVLVFGYFGWHHGASVNGPAQPGQPFSEVGIAITLFVLWLMLLPFLGNRLARGRWSADYHEFFTQAWRNKLLLAEAALFTVVFWLLLALWATLFQLLGIAFFRELFREPLFIYPVTAIAFGLALYLIGSVERFVGVVLEQILGLFKWLAVIAGLILTLFSVALLFKLPGLIGTGTRIINAAWLLWLLAVMVLLLNAAYRDGSADRPYPAAIATALRYAVPLMVLVALVALYSIGVRIARYGLTTDRFWAVVVALAALVYAAGYSSSAIRGGRWMSGMGRINVGVAIGLIVVLALAMTPVLSPYRLAADSQYEQILAGRSATSADVLARLQFDDGYRSLRFNTGRYGRERLQQLAALEDHPDAAQIRERATAALAATQYWAWTPPGADFDVDNLRIFPDGRSLEPALVALLQPEAANAGQPLPLNVLGCIRDESQCAGLFVDLDADGVEEFIVISPYNTQLFVRTGDGWRHEITTSINVAGDVQSLLPALERGDFSTQTPRYRDLRVGDRVLQIMSSPSFPARPPIATSPASSPQPALSTEP